MQEDLFSRLGHNGGPPLDDARIEPSWLFSMDEAQAREDVNLRPSMLQRYAGTNSPKRLIVGYLGVGSLGAWLLLECGHPKDVRDWHTKRALGKPTPTHVRCGCCRERIKPDDRLLAEVERLRNEP